jgi:hypothetical protein
VLLKFAITTVMLGLVLLALTPQVRQLGELGAATPTRDRAQLVVAPAVSTTLLLVVTVLSTYKPWGRLRRASAPASRRAVPAGRA